MSALRQAQGERWLGAVAIGLMLAATPAAAQKRQRTEVTPYIEVGQVLTADLQSDDVLTYSTVAAGIDVSAQTRRVEVQLSYKYERRIAYQKDVADDDIHSGLARVSAQVAPGFGIEAAGIATRARSDIRGDAPVNLAGNVNNVTQVYSAYAGPTVSTHAGALNVNAAYRFGYTKAEAPGFTNVPAGQPKLDNYDHSTQHLATASVGVKSGTVLPVGVTVSGAWEREDASQLDQRYDGKYARGDVVVPVARGLALEGGVGYEKIEISQRDPVYGADGQPVTDGAGRFVTDESSPRRLAYDIDGIFWDAGVVWRPSPRTSLEARVGRRYDSWTYTGSLSYQMSKSSGFQIGVYDAMQSFGRQLNDGLAALPTSFQVNDDPFGNAWSGCVFGTTGGAAGGCLSDVFQAISTSNYRARGVNGVFVVDRGPLRYGFGVGYANRRFYAPRPASGFTIDGVTDEMYFGQFFAGERLGPRGELSGNLYATWSQSGIAGAPWVWGYGGNASYSYSFGRLAAMASLGMFGTEQQAAAEAELSAQALLGMRYQF